MRKINSIVGAVSVEQAGAGIWIDVETEGQKITVVLDEDDCTKLIKALFIALIKQLSASAKRSTLLAIFTLRSKKKAVKLLA